MHGSHIIEVPIGSLAWLVGEWEGDVDGQIVRECWLEAKGGQQVGAFTWFKDNNPWLYEFILLGSWQGSTQMRIRHMGPDVSSWEEKDAWTEFSLVEAAPNRAVFLQTNKPGPWLVYHRDGDRLKSWFESVEDDHALKNVFEYTLRR